MNFRTRAWGVSVVPRLHPVNQPNLTKPHFLFHQPADLVSQPPVRPGWMGVEAPRLPAASRLRNPRPRGHRCTCSQPARPGRAYSLPAAGFVSANGPPTSLSARPNPAGLSALLPPTPGSAPRLCSPRLRFCLFAFAFSPPGLPFRSRFCSFSGLRLSRGRTWEANLETHLSGSPPPPPLQPLFPRLLPDVSSRA